MFAKIASLATFAGLAAAAAIDVWIPQITSPTNETVWPIGTVQNVTWWVLTSELSGADYYMLTL